MIYHNYPQKGEIQQKKKVMAWRSALNRTFLFLNEAKQKYNFQIFEDRMVFTREDTAEKDKLEEVQSYREAFDHYDWNKNGRVSVKVNSLQQLDIQN